jgi:hypothetical protein
MPKPTKQQFKTDALSIRNVARQFQVLAARQRSDPLISAHKNTSKATDLKVLRNFEKS